MNYFLYLSLSIFIFTGCSHKNGFAYLNLTKKQEITTSFLKSSKIIDSKTKVYGLFSVIYLKNIEKKLSKNNELFYLTIYIKNKNYDIESDLKLNNQEPIYVEELPFDNKYNKFLYGKNIWNKNYLLKYKKDINKNLKLIFKHKNNYSDLIVYKKVNY